MHLLMNRTLITSLLLDCQQRTAVSLTIYRMDVWNVWFFDKFLADCDLITLIACLDCGKTLSKKPRMHTREQNYAKVT